MNIFFYTNRVQTNPNPVLIKSGINLDRMIDFQVIGSNVVIRLDASITYKVREKSEIRHESEPIVVIIHEPNEVSDFLTLVGAPNNYFDYFDNLDKTPQNEDTQG